MKQGALYQVQLEVGSENPVHEVIGTSSSLSKIEDIVKKDMAFLIEDNAFECRSEVTPEATMYFPALKSEPEGKGWQECLENAPRIIYRVTAVG